MAKKRPARPSNNGSKPNYNAELYVDLPEDQFCATTLPQTRLTQRQAIALKVAQIGLNNVGEKCEMTEFESHGGKYIELPAHVVRYLLDCWADEWEHARGKKLLDFCKTQTFNP